jgi:hypothetical protein
MAATAGYTMGFNQFADWTKQEVDSILNNNQMPKGELNTTPIQVPNDLAETVSWKAVFKGARNQG